MVKNNLLIHVKTRLIKTDCQIEVWDKTTYFDLQISLKFNKIIQGLLPQ